MTIIDITRPLAGNSLAYPGDTAPHFIQSDAGLYLVSDIRMSSHSGTHIDAPVHYLKTGLTVDELPLSHLIGPCRVLDVSGAGPLIDVSWIKNRTDGVPRILLKTVFSTCTSFSEEYPSLTLDAAKYLTSTGTLCIGIDSFSIEKFDCDGSVHRELLHHGCLIIELLDLSHVPEGDYTIFALPLRLAGLDGAPARVILVTNDGGK
ncbi:cyclase family protein [Methanoregula sp.]|uniref:cyclase family protein n=1 Tax=Methanoregula sp. TaxID=2052170 RepID=UPI0023761125|nr:cyclase family protein [Methanoregula sp.]MDD1687666.1 cyclase family protein [Methanoregula sp.]